MVGENVAEIQQVNVILKHIKIIFDNIPMSGTASSYGYNITRNNLNLLDPLLKSFSEKNISGFNEIYSKYFSLRVDSGYDPNIKVIRALSPIQSFFRKYLLDLEKQNS